MKESINSVFGYIKAFLSDVRDGWKIIHGVGVTAVAFLATKYVELQDWKEKIQDVLPQVQNWFNQSKEFSLDLGLGYRIANYVAPVDEFLFCLGILLGLAVVVIAIKVGIFIISVMRILFVNDND